MCQNTRDNTNHGLSTKECSAPECRGKFPRQSSLGHHSCSDITCDFRRRSPDVYKNYTGQDVWSRRRGDYAVPGKFQARAEMSPRETYSD